MSLLKLNEGINRLSGEDESSYKMRIMLGKAKGYYAEYSWREIADLVGYPCKCESHFSDKAKGMLMLANYLTMSEDMDLKDLKSLLMLENKKLELAKQKIELSDTRSRLNKTVREQGRTEYVARSIADNISKWKESQKFKIERKYYNTTNKEAILLLSDWHFGQTSTNNVNDYNPHIAKQRIKELVEQTINYCELFNPKKLHIMLLGDMMNGLIHVTSRINSTLNITDQFTEVTKEIIDLVITLRDYFPAVNVYGVRGNHDRMTPNLKESVVSENFYDIMPFVLKLAFNDIDGIKMVDNKIDAEIITTKICNKNIVAVHGDKDRPKKVVENLTGLLSNLPDYIFMGHYHHKEEYEKFNSKVIVNGSFCGVDEYAKSKRLISKPSQSLLILDEEDFFCKMDITFKSGVYFSKNLQAFEEH